MFNNKKIKELEEKLDKYVERTTEKFYNKDKKIEAILEYLGYELKKEKIIIEGHCDFFHITPDIIDYKYTLVPKTKAKK